MAQVARSRSLAAAQADRSARASVAPALPATTPAAVPGRPRGRPRKTHSERDQGNRRRLIVEGAARLFRAKGFAAASTRDIAAAAGMRGGSPFYHFESKSALLYEVMREGMAQAAASQRAALARLGASATPRECLQALIRNHFEVLLGPGNDFIPVMLYEWRSLNAAQRRQIARTTDAYSAQWMPALEKLHAAGALRAKPHAARLLIFGALNWSVQWYSKQGPLSLDALAAEALALFVGDD
ncbi:MAG: Acyclic terpenes utilization regulator AtuR, TetR family [Burkholderiaceae bacterium]|jgi:AcrR family transcriptional regulator|nr:MAG: Acyclic terpenes utilization regulator AtuR, TetR family [Burkholderiaceae bacterium]